jgi:hypothetical protein
MSFDWLREVLISSKWAISGLQNLFLQNVLFCGAAILNQKKF